MTTKAQASRSSLKLKRSPRTPERIRQAAKSQHRNAVTGAFKTGVLAGVGAKGTTVEIDVHELAAAYPSGKIPMLSLSHVQIANRRFQGVLILDAKALKLATPKSEKRYWTTEKIVSPSDEEMLSLDEAISLLGASGRSSVNAMAAANRIFGVLPPGRIRGKRYPRWQFKYAIAGEPLRRILSELSDVDSIGKYQFFGSAFPELGHLTPIEVIAGHVERSVEMNDEKRAIIGAPRDQRVNLIVELAKEFAHPS